MSEDLVLYTHPMSRGRIARWMLEETGAPYRAEVLDYGPPMKQALASLSPMGKVPVVVHGETVVSEAAAVCLYLADAFPETDLAPPLGSRDRAAYYRWILFGAGPFEAAVTNKALGVSPSREQSGFVGYGDFDTTLSTLERQLEKNDYIATGRFSAADVYVGSSLDWAVRFGAVERRPVFEAYLERLRKRPARERAAAIDDELLAQAKARTSPG